MASIVGYLPARYSVARGADGRQLKTPAAADADGRVKELTRPSAS
jgi:hypothetical protein